MKASATLFRAALGATLALSTAAAMAQGSSTTTTRADTQRYYMPYERNFWSYAGGTVGRSDYDIGCSAGFDCDTKDTALKAFAGGKINPFFGLEGSYVYLGEASRGGGDTWGQGLNLSLVGTLPLSQSIGLNGRVGTIYGWTKVEGSAPGLATGREHGFGLSYGAGLNFALTRTVDLRLDWDRYRLDFKTGRDDVDVAAVGVAFKF